MYQEFTNSEARARNNSLMGADTISKNGRNPKSQTSRRKFLICSLLLLAFWGFGNNAMAKSWDIGHNSVPGGNYLSNVTATLNGNTLTISGSGDMADFWCTGVNQYDNGGEAPWWFDTADRNAIKTVEIKDGVTNIGMRAFKDCSYLESITISSSVTKINGQAFYNCIRLQTVTIESGDSPLKFVGYRSSDKCNPNSSSLDTYDWFEGCTSVLTLYLGRNLDTWYSSSDKKSPIYELKKTLTTLIIGCKVSEIGDFAFNSCQYLKEIEIKECEDELRFAGNSPYNCFDKCKLNTVYLGRNIKLVSSNASSFPPFRDNIKQPSSTLTIGSKVADIPAYSFYGCTGLDTIIATNNNVTSIGNNAFYNCTGLKNAPIGTKVITIGDNAFFQCKSLSKISIPSSVEQIGDYAFYKCEKLSKVDIADCEDCENKLNLRFVGNSPYNCFYGCTDLQKVYLGRNIKLVSPNASSYPPFRDNIKLSSSTLTIGSKVTEIINYAFYDCTGLTEIKIDTENNVTSIGNNAFNNCTALQNAPIGPKVITIGDNAFFQCKSLSKISIPSSVEQIGDYAFYKCEKLSKVDIADCEDCENKLNLRFVGNSPYNCFSGCALKTVYLGRNIKLVSPNASNYPPFRDNIKQPSSTLTIGSKVTEIINYAFYGCCGLEKIICYPEIPPTIYPNTFGGCGKSIPNCTVYVCPTCIDAYQKADYWSEFTDYLPIIVNIAEVQSSSLIIYPNPTTGELIIDNEQFTMNSAEYIIFNLTGQMVLHGTLQGETTTINVESLPSGMYYLRVAGKAVKFVKM